MPKFTLRPVSTRQWALAAALCAVAAGFAASRVNWVVAADADATAVSIPTGGVNIETPGSSLKALGLKPTQTDSRFDFQFAQKSTEEWELSMSVVLSNDGKTLWLMAWLDELPQNAADVPRTALLRLLADNDKIGNGQFFAYVSTNRRFVLQRVIANSNITNNTLRTDLIELGKTVINTHPHWAVDNWRTQGNTAPATDVPDAKGTDKSTGSPTATRSTGTTNAATANRSTGTAKQ